MRRTCLALAALAVGATPALAAPTIATPVAPWQASFEGGVCRMQRAFESGGEPHLLILEQNAPGPAIAIAMAGPSLAGLSPDVPLRVSFAADHAGFDKRAQIEPNRQFGHVAVVHGVWLDTRKPDAAGNPARIDTKAAQGVERIAVSQGDGSMSFATGPLAEAATALNDCTARIMSSWGLDPAAQHGLQRSAAPADTGRLVKELRKAYTRTALRTLQQGVIDLVVFTDPSGAATDCKMLVATGYDELDRSMCAAAVKERFTPAVDADGKAVASFWRMRTSLRVGFSG
ncbi:energy transducer TonB [Erythrobacter donghaensis]|uniref:energy transducer TonB n=1 Tax=Erythrobacter donghaensis TaxID=267135 RepID=UPI000A83DCEA|nr:energy transducer TonB [Erythrobacter donghaensis]